MKSLRIYFKYLLMSAFALSGCGTDMRKSGDHNHEPLRFPVDQVNLLHRPSMLLEEYCFPTNSVRQTFQWSDFGHEWNIDVRMKEWQHAGFSVRRPFAMAERRTDSTLYFQIKPESAAAHLAFYLISGNDAEVLHEARNLEAYSIGKDAKDWVLCAIDLAEFQNPGATLSPVRPIFDWDDIRKIQLNGIDQDSSVTHITIRNLRIRPQHLTIPSIHFTPCIHPDEQPSDRLK